jgi:hypothetical protein
MWKFMLFGSLLPLLTAWAGNHWLWGRARLRWLRQDTGKTQAQLREALGLGPRKKHSHTDAAHLGITLRDAGLELLENEGDAAAKARRKGVWLLRVLPVLVGVIAIFGIFSKRVPAGWALAGSFACVGLLVLLRLIGLTVELRAVIRGTNAVRKVRFFNRLGDEDAVISAAKSSIWLSVWPW